MDNRTITRLHNALLLTLPFLFWSGALVAEELAVKITKKIQYVNVNHEGQTVRLQRIQDQENVLTGGFAKTSRKCPPFCVKPITIAPDVKTVGELEIIEFIQTHLKNGSGILIDARTPAWHNKGTIPGSVNMPFYTFGKDESDPELREVLRKLGVVKKQAKSAGIIESAWAVIKDITGMEKEKPSNWDFSNAKELLLWCNGLWCGQSPRAIKNLLKLGYPPAKLRWYRGGMQSWRILGLTVVVPGAEMTP